MSGHGRKEIGAAGEDAAMRHLQGRGYAIVARNYRCPLGELDLVARDGDEYVFVEVKTRLTGVHVYPEEAVTPEKARRIVHLAEYFLDQHGDPETPWRIDVVAVHLGRNGEVVGIRHIRNAVF